ncbi:MAG: phosphatidylglycerophosphatase A [Magnetococcales bacterium]|nr:phosphatidylglycerophosphatase A [Magnetococcales bacterium]
MALFLATLGGVGRWPGAPGTWGTLVTVPLCALLQEGGFLVLAGALGVLTVVGLWAADVASRHLGHNDPREVVIDEAAGYLVTMLWAPPGWLWLALGFGLFRLFDIWKPWPVNWLDRRLHGGWGIMADDLAAGVYGALILALLERWGPLGGA